MFRRKSSSLPKDPVFPADLDALGYFMNDKDQIRYKKRPGLDFIFNINKNDRYNDVQREAMNQCIRNILVKRFENLGLITLRLPFTALPSEPHVPCLLTPDIDSKSRIILFFNEPHQNLGVLAYRTIGTHSIHKGSIEEFVTAIRTSKDPKAETPAVLIANPGELLWSREEGRAVTLTTWQALPRRSAVHEAKRIDPVRNRVPGNEHVEKHVAYIFEKVLCTIASHRAQIDVIALEWASTAVVKYLNANWSKLSSTVSTLVFGDPQYHHEDILDEDGNPSAFSNFVSRRGRAYLVADEPIDTPMNGREDFGCNCYASGEKYYSERIIEEAYPSILAWQDMAHSAPNYEEVEFIFQDDLTSVQEIATESDQQVVGDSAQQVARGSDKQVVDDS